MICGAVGLNYTNGVKKCLWVVRKFFRGVS